MQSHGALLALAEPDLTITVASANTAAVLGVAPDVLLGLPVADILGAEQARQLHEAASDDDSVAAIVPVQLEQRKTGYQLEASVHRSDGLVICEFERSADQLPCALGLIRIAHQNEAQSRDDGDVVHRGEVIGTVVAGHCASAVCLHLGARVGGEYVNPLVFLGGVPHAVLYPTRGG